jgi:hypothetical protein
VNYISKVMFALLISGNFVCGANDGQEDREETQRRRLENAADRARKEQIREAPPSLPKPGTYNEKSDSPPRGKVPSTFGKQNSR